MIYDKNFTRQDFVPKRSFYNILGALCKKPQLLFDEKYELNVNDFEIDLYKIIFSAINNMIINNPNISSITAIDIDNYISQIKKAYNIYTLHGGFKYISNMINDTNVELFEQNYNNIKKFSLLRDLLDNGFHVEELYNPKNSNLEEESEKFQKLDKMTLQNILDYFDMKMLNVKTLWDIKGEHKSYKIGDEIETLLDNLQNEGVYGHPFMNDYYNSIFRGMQKGKLFLRSAGTGGSKTRSALADMVMVACDEIYDLEKNKFVSIGGKSACCFISTEIQLKSIQTTLLAIITGINENTIKDGNYSYEIKKRLEYGVEIIKRSPIYLHYLPEYNINDISNIIEKDILQYNVEYVWHDYIMYNGKLAKKTSEEYGTNSLREDLVLVNLSARLKQLAEKYDVFIATSTQLNRSAKDHENRDTNAIRGSSAIVDKVDMAVLMFRAAAKDVDKLEHITRSGFYKTPNFCHYVFKNRENESNMIIWTQRNLGNMREEMCFVTDFDYQLLGHIKPMKIDFKY